MKNISRIDACHELVESEPLDTETLVFPILERIKDRIQSTLYFAYLNGKDLCEIREILGGQFVKWLKSENWPYSDRVAYNYIGFFESCDRAGLEESEIKNIKINFTKITSLLTKKNHQLGKEVLSAAKEGVTITPDYLAELESKTPIGVRKLDYTDLPKVGCRNCKHYLQSYGREKCNFYDEFFKDLEKQFQIDVSLGCDRLIEMTPTKERDVSQVALSEQCWKKVLFAASKKNADPEVFIEQILIEGFEENDRLQIRVEDLERRLKDMEFERNDLILKLKKMAADERDHL